MCVAEGSIDLLTSVCPMCKYFRPTGIRCPHKRDVCRNKANHPRHDVVHLTNAEVQSFNGCGYCKWAATDPPATKAGLHNPGWPGCCRPPLPTEYVMIQPADWPAVNAVHRVPIPSDIKQILDKVMGPGSVQIPLGINTGSLRSGSSSTSPTSERRKRIIASSVSSSSAISRSPSVNIPQRVRSGASPPMRPSSLTVAGGRAASGVQDASPGSGLSSSMDAISPSTPSSRTGPADMPLNRIEGFRTTPPASVRKLGDADYATIHHTPGSRPSLSAAHLSSPSVVTVSNGDPAQRTLKRRASITSTGSSPLSSGGSRGTGTPKAISKAQNKTPTKTDPGVSLEMSLKTMNLASDTLTDSGSTKGSSEGSRGDSSTITSEGFTDYLSDESDAELQRQAEQRAVVAEHNRMEEQEFRAARQQLASVGLQPPQAWTTGLISRGYIHMPS